MVLKLVVAAILLGIATSAKFPDRIMGRPRGGFKIDLYHKSSTAPKVKFGFNSGEAYFEQRLDHFNDSNSLTWSQHYFYNKKFFDGRKNGGVAFLMIGGEGPETAHWVLEETLPYIQWAKQFSAAVYDLEHRFYGKSRPTGDQSVENLKYLSSRQAIEDIAFFIKYVNTQEGWTNTKWIVFGGSYSGALALWFRELHPELATGAVGSSGPVEATVDFYKYLQVVEASLGTYENSTECVDAVRTAFVELQELMSTQEGRDSLDTKFELQPTFRQIIDENGMLSYNDLQNFYTNMYGNFQGAVQYSGDNAGSFADAYGIDNVCEYMLNGTDPIAGLVQVNKYMNTQGEDISKFEGTYNNYTGMIVSMQDTSFDSISADSRSWTWQTCTEFGYFQSTDKSAGIFGPVGPNNLYINMCTDLFGTEFNADSITESVRKTNEHYGGAHKYTGTNVVIPNGSLDPWHALGKYTSDDYSQVWYLINGSAHCGDMYPVSEKTAQRYAVIHSLTARHINLWVNSPPNPITRLNVTTAVEKNVAEQKNVVEKKFVSVIEDLGPKISQLKPGRRFHRPLNGRPPHGFMPSPEMDLSTVNLNGYTAFTFTQPLCHFNNQMPETFKQRMWTSTRFAKPNGPNFLMIGGEGPENPEKWILNDNVAWLQYAKEHGATVYLMEHRCYGDSHDIGNSTYRTDSVMLFCSAHQALYDVKQFIETMNYINGNNGPWVTFGGSYSGSLSLFARESFPDLIIGAVGSSAPVEPKVDFFEYLEVTERSLREYSNDCAENIKVAFEQMSQMILYPEGRKNLSDIFTLEPAWNNKTELTPTDAQYFFSNIYSQFQGAVQYSGDNTAGYSSGYGIPDVCQIMENGTNDPLTNVAAVNAYMIEFYTGDPFKSTDNSYKAMIKFLQDPEQGGASRTWTYQTCNEWGYFQSTDYGYGIFGSPTPVNLYLKMCADIFLDKSTGQRNDGNLREGSDYTTDSIYASAEFQRKRYGGQHYYRGSNVVAPHGTVDPWHRLAILKHDDPSVVVLRMNGTAHCADMYPPRPQDVPDLVAARKTISANIGKWLRLTPQTDTTAATVNPTTTSESSTPSPLLFSLVVVLLGRIIHIL